MAWFGKKKNSFADEATNLRNRGRIAEISRETEQEEDYLSQLRQRISVEKQSIMSIENLVQSLEKEEIDSKEILKKIKIGIARLMSPINGRDREIVRNGMMSAVSGLITIESDILSKAGEFVEQTNHLINVDEKIIREAGKDRKLLRKLYEHMEELHTENGVKENPTEKVKIASKYLDRYTETLSYAEKIVKRAKQYGLDLEKKTDNFRKKCENLQRDLQSGRINEAKLSIDALIDEERKLQKISEFLDTEVKSEMTAQLQKLTQISNVLHL